MGREARMPRSSATTCTPPNNTHGGKTRGGAAALCSGGGGSARVKVRVPRGCHVGRCTVCGRTRLWLCPRMNVCVCV
jgi:hypothetical protein